jgi:hypothetical protein
MIEIVKLLQRKDVKSEISKICVPILEIILCIINPYIYIILTFIFIIFVMNLAILIILLRNNNYYLNLKYRCQHPVI